MNGRLEVVASELDKGTTICLDVPLERPISSSTTTAAGVKKDENNRPPSIVEKDLSLHILVVEDNKVNQKMMRNMLQRIGHTVTVAEWRRHNKGLIAKIQGVDSRDEAEA